MTHNRQIVLSVAAAEMKKQAANLYDAVNNHDETKINLAIHEIRNLHLHLTFANNNTFTPDIKKIYNLV